MTNSKTLSVVIGGTSGIGFESALMLSKYSTHLIITGRNESKLNKAITRLKNRGIKVEGVLLNLHDHNDVHSFIDKINNLKLKITYLINSAGSFKPIPFLKHSFHDYSEQLDINKSFFFITQSVAKKMKANNFGVIINIGSMWASQAIKATPSSAYSMQKAGLHILTKHLAMELAEFGIRVNAVAPAVVHTPIYSSFIDENQIEEELNAFNDFHPLGRIGQVKDISNAIEFLISEQSSWITGEILNVDGGVMSGRN